MQKKFRGIFTLLPFMALFAHTTPMIGVEDVLDIVEDDAADAVEKPVQHIQSDEVPLIDAEDLVETPEIASVTVGNNFDFPASKDVDLIERIIVIDSHQNNHHDGHMKLEMQGTEPSREIRSTRPELGSTRHKTRKMLRDIPVLKRKKDSSIIVPNAQMISNKQIEPMIEGHQALNDSLGNEEKPLLMKVALD